MQPVNDIPKIADINRTNIFNLTLLIDIFLLDYLSVS